VIDVAGMFVDSEEPTMDFVERWLNVSPDGGSGSFEAATILAVLIVVCILGFGRKVQTVWDKRLGNIARPR
jgi:hypothetical protein